MIRIGPQKRINFIPGIGVNVISGRVSAAASNWWNAGGCPDAVWADVWESANAADYATSKVGLVNSTELSEGNGAVSWTSGTGWQFVAADSKYLDTGIVPAAGYGLIVQFADASGGAEHGACGIYDGLRRFYLRPISTYGHVYGYGDSPNIVSGTLESGNMAISDSNCFLNGVSEGTAGTWTAMSIHAMIGGEGYSSGTKNFFTGTILRIGIAVSDFSAYVADIAAAMAA